MHGSKCATPDSYTWGRQGSERRAACVCCAGPCIRSFLRSGEVTAPAVPSPEFSWHRQAARQRRRRRRRLAARGAHPFVGSASVIQRRRMRKDDPNDGGGLPPDADDPGNEAPGKGNQALVVESPPGGKQSMVVQEQLPE